MNREYQLYDHFLNVPEPEEFNWTQTYLEQIDQMNRWAPNLVIWRNPKYNPDNLGADELLKEVVEARFELLLKASRLQPAPIFRVEPEPQEPFKPKATLKDRFFGPSDNSNPDSGMYFMIHEHG